MKKIRLPNWMRKLHRWATPIIAIPFLIILISGILLQWKKNIPWIQPPSQKGVGKIPSISFAHILKSAQQRAEAEITDWQDIDRLDVRPSKGMVKVRSKNGWEVQVDTETGEVLQVAYRRSDFIEAIHDGTWFHDRVKLWVFFPVALVMVLLFITGIYLFYLPYKKKWGRKKL